MSEAAKKSRRQDQGPRRRAARLAAVQALYEMEMAGAGADPVLLEFQEDRWNSAMEEGSGAISKPNLHLLSEVTRGTAARSAELDLLIGQALTGTSSLNRMEILLKIIMRAAAFELSEQESGVPASVIISEYVDIANAFFPENETSLVNGVLDRLARLLRPKEQMK